MSKYSLLILICFILLVNKIKSCNGLPKNSENRAFISSDKTENSTLVTLKSNNGTIDALEG